MECLSDDTPLARLVQKRDLRRVTREALQVQVDAMPFFETNGLVIGMPDASAGEDLRVAHHTQVYSVVQVRVRINTAITNRLVSGQFTDAFLIVDEPHTPGNPARPLLACGSPTAPADTSGNCSITATSNPADFHDGTAGHPNVFQGKLVNAGSDQYLAFDLPFSAPAADQRGAFLQEHGRDHLYRLEFWESGDAIYV